MKIKNTFLLTSIFFLNSFCLFSATAQEKNPACEIILTINDSRALSAVNKGLLDYFIQTLNGKVSLGIVSFEKDAKIIFPLKSLINKEDKQAAQASLGGLTFKSKYSDVSEGLKLSVSQFGNSKKNQAKIILLLSNGRIYPPRRKIDKDKFIEELENDILSVTGSNDIVIYTLAFGSEDLELMQEIAHKTKGKSFVVYNNEALNDILSIIKEKTEPALVAPVLAQPIVKLMPLSPKPNRFLYQNNALLALLILLTFFLTLNNSRKLNRVLKPVDVSKVKAKDVASLASLHASVERLSKIFTEGTLDFRNLQLDIEDSYARSFAKEKELKTKYLRLLDNLFLLIDYLEDALKVDKKQEPIEWFYKRVLRILDEEGICEISLKTGERFDGAFHKHSGTRLSELPKGAILELVRKGYLIRGKAKEADIVLRPAEVIVSSGVKV